MGNLDEAEKYLKAAWTVSQSAVIAGHLGQVYEQQHRTEDAIHLYRLALYRFTQPPRATPASDDEQATRKRLDHLESAKAVDDHGMSARSDELTQMRTFKLPRLVPKEANAEFFVLLAPGSKVDDVKFVSGSEELKSGASALRGLNFKVSFPDNGPARVLRRGILSCYPSSGCSFVLYYLGDVHTVN
jgi:hypothetical protein